MNIFRIFANENEYYFTRMPHHNFLIWLGRSLKVTYQTPIGRTIWQKVVNPCFFRVQLR